MNAVYTKIRRRSKKRLAQLVKHPLLPALLDLLSGPFARRMRCLKFAQKECESSIYKIDFQARLGAPSLEVKIVLGKIL
jgi:hypothetical protein